MNYHHVGLTLALTVTLALALTLTLTLAQVALELLDRGLVGGCMRHLLHAGHLAGLALRLGSEVAWGWGFG